MITKIVTRIPKHAKYDYTDIYGYKHYHTKNRGYYKTYCHVYSWSLKDEENE